MENTQIAHIFEHMAEMLELKGGNQFRVRAYQNTARALNNLSERVEDMVQAGSDLSKLSNIGKSSAEKIKEIVGTGTCKRLQELKSEIPESLTELIQIPQLGARKVKLINDKLGVESVEDLETACKEHRVRELEGMGAKTEENILKGIQTVQAASGRTMLKEALEQVNAIGRLLEERTEISQWQVAGSFRRQRETVGDLDILVESTDRNATADSILGSDLVEDVIGSGQQKVSVRLYGGLQVDFRFFEKDAFGAALMYFTGSKSHNIAVRQRAIESGWKLNEYGLFEDNKQIGGKTEEDIYRSLDMSWVPPELREDAGEIEAAVNGELPCLVEQSQMYGDLHCHTVASDGKNTIEEMAFAAKARGYEYLGICDHSKAVSVANGLDEERILKHASDIREVSEKFRDFRIMAGIEVDILKDGTLDLDEEVLSQLDWVTASTHFHLNLSSEDMTKRLLKAIKSGVVNCIGHPFARQIGRRDPIIFDVDEVFSACADYGVCLEINSQPERLDLLDVYCRKAKEAGIKMVISTDAHTADDLDFMRFGIGIARRGWLEKDDILNTRPQNDLAAFLEGDKFC